MKTTIVYPTHDPDRYMNAVNDIINWMGPKRYEEKLSIFASHFDPCTWTMEYFHLYCGMMGFEGYPAIVFAYEVMAYWENH